jgi:hypothetical protein
MGIFAWLQANEDVATAMSISSRKRFIRVAWTSGLKPLFVGLHTARLKPCPPDNL